MEEKERYKIDKSTNYYTNTIVDTKTNAYYGNVEEHIDLLNKQNKENQQLKQQLHDLPKKVVEEITNELSNNTSLYFEMRESTSAHCPNQEYEWFNYVRFRDYVNAILKDYQK